MKNRIGIVLILFSQAAAPLASHGAMIPQGSMDNAVSAAAARADSLFTAIASVQNDQYSVGHYRRENPDCQVADAARGKVVCTVTLSRRSDDLWVNGLEFTFDVDSRSPDRQIRVDVDKIENVEH